MEGTSILGDQVGGGWEGNINKLLAAATRDSPNPRSRSTERKIQAWGLVSVEMEEGSRERVGEGGTYLRMLFYSYKVESNTA